MKRKIMKLKNNKLVLQHNYREDNFSNMKNNKMS